MVRITTLVENTTSNPDLRCKHGLSLYIETERHKILFDVGPNDLLLENAGKLGVDLSSVDTVIISHGHMDHGGALGCFLSVNSSARVYVRNNAFDPHYTTVLELPYSIALDKDLKNHPQIVLTSEEYVIDDELVLFSNTEHSFPKPTSNSRLKMKNDGKICLDTFTHEHNLVVRDGDRRLLVCGCSHNGIVNIVDSFRKRFSCDPDRVVGGFHLFSPGSRKYESRDYIGSVARRLYQTDGTFYTCHCTGPDAFSIMKETLGDRVKYLSVGTMTEL